jgi:hypothetical protein
MATAKQMIEAKFESSGFALTIETKESVGYRSGLKTDLLRAVYIHLERRAVEYELAQRGAPSRHRVEHFETIEQLLGQLPTDTASFDLKFQGLKPESDGTAAKMAGRPRANTYTTEDPWDLTNYYAPPRSEKTHSPSGLRLVDQDLS